MGSAGWDDAPRSVDEAIAAFNALEEVQAPFEYGDRHHQLAAAADRPDRSYLADDEWIRADVAALEASGVRVRSVPNGTLVNLAGVEFDEQGWSQFEVDGEVVALQDSSGRELDGLTVASHADGNGEHVAVQVRPDEWMKVSPAVLVEVLNRRELLAVGDGSPINLVGCGIAGPYAQEVANLTGRPVRASFLSVNMNRGEMTPRAHAQGSSWVFSFSGADAANLWVVHESQATRELGRAPTTGRIARPAARAADMGIG